MENFIRIFNTSKILHGRIIKIFCMMDYNIKEAGEEITIRKSLTYSAAAVPAG